MSLESITEKLGPQAMGKKVRIAFVSFRLESNFHAPVVGRQDFVPDDYFAGEEFERLFTEKAIRVPKEPIDLVSVLSSPAPSTARIKPDSPNP